MSQEYLEIAIKGVERRISKCSLEIIDWAKREFENDGKLQSDSYAMDKLQDYMKTREHLISIKNYLLTLRVPF